MSATASFPVNPFEQQYFIGMVCQVGPSTVEVMLPAVSGVNGSSVPSNVGDYVIIGCGQHGIFGQMTDLRIPQTVGPNGELRPIGVVKLLSSISLSNASVSSGILTHPQIGNRVFAAHPAIVRMVAEARNRGYGQDDPVLLNIGVLPDGSETPVSFTPEMIFARHCAVLGTTGGGKSWTVARLIEEAANHKSKVILFDATGEYAALDRHTRHVHLGADPNPRKDSEEVALPYYQLTERDLFAIFKPQGQSQAPKLRAAIKSLKLALHAPTLALDGTIIKANKQKVHYEEAYRRFYRQIESPNAEFDITKLARQIENECVKPNRSALEPQFWGDLNGADQALCVPLINRIQDIIGSPNLATIFFPQGKSSLIKVIDEFIVDPTVRVLRVSLQYLSFAHNAREIVANATGRRLLQLAREDVFRENPMVVIVDEAHQFLNKTLEDPSGSFPLDSFGIVAKEGRKYGISICIATQRPRDIPEDVLSQMGTLIVHRLINDRDRAVVERASGEMDRSALDTLPALAPGHAVMVGIEFPIPLAVRVAAPTYRPLSSGPMYQKFWKIR